MKRAKDEKSNVPEGYIEGYIAVPGLGFAEFKAPRKEKTMSGYQYKGGYQGLIDLTQIMMDNIDKEGNTDRDRLRWRMDTVCEYLEILQRNPLRKGEEEPQYEALKAKLEELQILYGIYPG